MRLATLYQERGNLILLCWCAPKPCHADIVAEAITEIVRRRMAAQIVARDLAVLPYSVTQPTICDPSGQNVSDEKP